MLLFVVAAGAAMHRVVGVDAPWLGGRRKGLVDFSIGVAGLVGTEGGITAGGVTFTGSAVFTIFTCS